MRVWEHMLVHECSVTICDVLNQDESTPSGCAIKVLVLVVNGSSLQFASVYGYSSNFDIAKQQYSVSDV